MQKSISLLLIAVLLLCLFGCSSPASGDTAERSSTTAPSLGDHALTLYPLEADSRYIDYAASVPNVIYNTTAAENGLAGNIYILDGVLEKTTSLTVGDESMIYENSYITTDHGTVIITNYYKAFYDASVEEFGQSTVDAMCPDDINNYVLPQIGERARFLVIYHGYSNKENAPVFIFGANSLLFEISGLDDPTTDKSYLETLPSLPDTQPTTPPATDSPDDEHLTTGQINALRSANSYLKYSAFSYLGLIGQLEYDGYTNSESKYAADNCGANWNDQALKSAKSYLNYSAFSYSGLIEQLEYEEFTQSQSKYAADNCGADWYEQAVKCAASYLKYSAFSRQRLIEQLEYEGFTYDQAVYGVEQNGL